MSVFLILTMLVLSGWFGSQHPPTGDRVDAAPLQDSLKASLERGEELYKQHCLTCHQADGNGVPHLNPPLSKTDYVLGDKERLIRIILEGMNEEVEINGEYFANPMPPQNFLNDQQVADVLTFVRNSFGNEADAVTPAEVKAVRK